MRKERTDAEKAQIVFAAGVTAFLAARVLLRISDSPRLDLGALIVALVALVVLCYGVSRLAVSKGHSAAWGFAGVMGFFIVYYLLKPKAPPPDLRRVPPPPPPPGFVPTR